MSLLRHALPWSLLAVSLAANGWLLLHRAPPPGHEPAPRPAPIGHWSLDIGHSAVGHFPVATSPPPAPAPTLPPPSTPPVATFSAYADLLAHSLETAEQHDDLARVLARWIASDPASASEWLNRQPDDPRFDLPVSQVAVHLTAKGDYALAREWADSIRTPEVRALAIEEILAEQYRHHQLTPATLADAATRAGLGAERVRAILDYSRLD